jgi:hypothetical protein
MNFGTSTKEVRLKADATYRPEDANDGRGVRLQPDHSLQPWQFFILAALGCATTIAYLSRGQGLVVVILGTVLMATAGIIGLAALRALRPLVSPEGDRTMMVGLRTRVALEREKLLTLRTIKELEFDRAMGKLSDADWQEMSGKLRARAAGLMRQLDAATGYREQIEKDLAKRLGTRSEDVRRAGPVDPPVCASCSTANDPDARFCKSCGQKL